MMDLFIGICLVIGMTISMNGACLMIADKQKQWLKNREE